MTNDNTENETKQNDEENHDQADYNSFILPHPSIPNRFCVGEEAFFRALAEENKIDEFKEILGGNNWQKPQR